MERIIGIIDCNYPGASGNPLTAERPAASLPFYGRYRFIDFPLSNLTNAGVNTVGLIMPTNYRSIVDHVGSGKEWGLARKRGGLFPLPGSPLGTARRGGRFLLKDFIDNNAIFLRNEYDYALFTTANFVFKADFYSLISAHKNSGSDITMLAGNIQSKNYNPCIMSIKTVQGTRVGSVCMGANPEDLAFLDAFIINKSTLLDLLKWHKTASYLDLFECLNDSFSFLKVNVFEHSGYTVPVFDKDAYYQVNMDMLNPEIARELSSEENPIRTKSHDSTPTKYGKSCSVSNALISSGCRIYGSVEGSVLGRRVVVGADAVVKDCIIMQGSVIKNGAHVENAIIDRNNIISAGVNLNGTKNDILYIGKSDDYSDGTIENT